MQDRTRHHNSEHPSIARARLVCLQRQTLTTRLILQSNLLMLAWGQLSHLRWLQRNVAAKSYCSGPFSKATTFQAC